MGQTAHCLNGQTDELANVQERQDWADHGVGNPYLPLKYRHSCPSRGVLETHS